MYASQYNTFPGSSANVEQDSDATGKTLQEPDVGDRRSQIDMPHALTTNLRLNDLNTTLFAGDAAVLHALVLTAKTFVILYWSENLGAEEAILPA